MLSIFISPFDLSRLASGLVFCLTVMLLSVAFAENPAQTKTVPVSKVKPQTKKSKTQKTSVSELKDRKILNTIDAKREKLALAFAKLHHPELAELIQRLKKHKPREYKRAIRVLDTTLAKLDRFKNRDSERYRLTLERWEVDSRIRLLAARVSVMGSSEDKSELKSLIKQRVALHLEQLRHDHKMAENRIKKLEKSISEIEKNQESMVDAELKKVQRSIKKTGQPNKNKSKK
ncbi:hypothetical protein [uncultured Gimesia sp.]|uniref:hypothetical protein n=1 Tax=uncultured Gimesia sp. TaxID=1678688 RepID=UPI00260FCD7E|nr:hypothetical protein [uncultured Gimesia sp.]